MSFILFLCCLCDRVGNPFTQSQVVSLEFVLPDQMSDSNSCREPVVGLRDRKLCHIGLVVPRWLLWSMFPGSFPGVPLNMGQGVALFRKPQGKYLVSEVSGDPQINLYPHVKILGCLYPVTRVDLYQVLCELRPRLMCLPTWSHLALRAGFRFRFWNLGNDWFSQ